MKYIFNKGKECIAIQKIYNFNLVNLQLNIYHIHKLYIMNFLIQNINNI